MGSSSTESEKISNEDGKISCLISNLRNSIIYSISVEQGQSGEVGV